MSANFELDKFDGNEDFSLWRTKLKSLFIQQKVGKIHDDPKTCFESITKDKQQEMKEIA